MVKKYCTDLSYKTSSTNISIPVDSQWAKIHNYVDFIIFINYSIVFYKIEKLKKKSYVYCGTLTRNRWVWRLRNTSAIGCAKKTAENTFNVDRVYLF